jgi:hypothetical protein
MPLAMKQQEFNGYSQEYMSLHLEMSRNGYCKMEKTGQM